MECLGFYSYICGMKLQENTAIVNLKEYNDLVKFKKEVTVGKLIKYQWSRGRWATPAYLTPDEAKEELVTMLGNIVKEREDLDLTRKEFDDKIAEETNKRSDADKIAQLEIKKLTIWGLIKFKYKK